MPRAFDISSTSRRSVRLASQPASEVLYTRGLTTVEAHSLADAAFVEAPPVHGLLGAVHVAFDQHLPLVLSPDAFWVTVAQGIARHVDANAEALRSGIVRHQGRA